MSLIPAIGLYLVAAVAEIAGCFAFWAVLRLHKPSWWLIVGVISLGLFAFTLTRIDLEFAGRAYAAYGGVYIFASVCWLWLVEDQVPDIADFMGVALCLAGAAVIVLGHRNA